MYDSRSLNLKRSDDNIILNPDNNLNKLKNQMFKSDEDMQT